MVINTKMKARLRFYAKNEINERYIVELVIHEVGRSANYPDGIKYGLICKDLDTGDYVLLDNHYPKGPHVHVNDKEFSYNYVDDEKLIKDFKSLVLRELGVKI